MVDLNSRTTVALYEVFYSGQARTLAERLEFSTLRNIEVGWTLSLAQSEVSL
jgi:hypothetical protein